LISACSASPTPKRRGPLRDGHGPRNGIRHGARGPRGGAPSTARALGIGDSALQGLAVPLPRAAFAMRPARMTKPSPGLCKQKEPHAPPRSGRPLQPALLASACRESWSPAGCASVAVTLGRLGQGRRPRSARAGTQRRRQRRRRRPRAAAAQRGHGGSVGGATSKRPAARRGAAGAKPAERRPSPARGGSAGAAGGLGGSAGKNQADGGPCVGNARLRDPASSAAGTPTRNDKSRFASRENANANGGRSALPRDNSQCERPRSLQLEGARVHRVLRERRPVRRRANRCADESRRNHQCLLGVHERQRFVRKPITVRNATRSVRTRRKNWVCSESIRERSCVRSARASPRRAATHCPVRTLFVNVVRGRQIPSRACHEGRAARPTTTAARPYPFCSKGVVEVYPGVEDRLLQPRTTDDGRRSGRAVSSIFFFFRRGIRGGALRGCATAWPSASWFLARGARRDRAGRIARPDPFKRVVGRRGFFPSARGRL